MQRAPLTRRDGVLDLLAAQRRPVHIAEIASRLGVEQPYTALQRLLDDMSFDGSIVALPGQRFKLSREQVEQRQAVYEGILNVNPRGFGFVTAAGKPDDLYVPADAMRGALHGDTVRVRIVARSRRGLEGEVVEVIQRRSTRVAGTLRRRGRSTWLEPDDTRMRGPIVLTGQKADVSGNDGDAAVAKITRFPELPDENPEGLLEGVLGVPGDPNVEVAKILLREGIDEEHAPDVVTEAQAFGEEVAEDALEGREDLTALPLPTIDPEDARDHDDAVWVVRNDDGSYRAWIAIADVSHYVRPGTALDGAALARGNSIYLPDRAIPMLPRALSSNLCSLLPHVVRLCLCVEIDLDATGETRGYRIVEGFMRSAAKLSYPGVARALGFTTEAVRSDEADALRDDLRTMWDLAMVLRARRLRRGALDFDLPEGRVVLDEETGAPLAVQRRAHDPGVKKAYQLIEELMLLANETVARFLVERNVPAIFRVHAPPNEEKLGRFVSMCEELDVKFELEEALDPKRLASLLKRIGSHPKREVLHMLLLRAMKQAAYDVANVGHFGLASPAYLHFTSPIRRYPDLVVHRSVRAVLRGDRIDRDERAVEKLRLAATVASDMERRGMDVEREVVDLYGALYMRAHVGSAFEGIVTGLAGSGVFVQLADPFVDVLVRMEALGSDSYEIDDEGLRLVGVRSGERIAIGDRMMVVVEDVSVLRRTVYARRLAGEETRPAKRTKRTRAAEAQPSPRAKRADRKTRPTRTTRTSKPSKRKTRGKNARRR